MQNTHDQAIRIQIHRLGSQLRLGGLFYSATALIGAATSAHPTGLETTGRTAILAIGLHAMTYMNHVCSEAAKHALNPVDAARSGLKTVPPFSVLFLVAASHMAISGMSHVAQPEENATGEQAQPLLSPSASLKDAIRKEDPACPRGSSTITVDDATHRVVITTCTGAPEPDGL